MGIFLLTAWELWDKKGQKKKPEDFHVLSH